MTFSYDALGRRTVMVDPSGRTTYTYDAAGRLTVQVAPPGKAVTYTYDAVGNRATMVDPDGGTTTYAYDARNGLTGLVNPLQERTTCQYDVLGRIVTLTHTNGATAGYSYNAAGWVTNLVNAKSSAVTITSHAYTTHDENGNTLVWNASGSRTTLTWGYEDEVLTVQPSSGDPVTMTYDGDHMRRKREEGAATAKYLWDGAQVLMDLDADDATVARYTLAPFGYGDLLSQRRSNATRFYHFDAIGSTRALTGSDEAVTDAYLYDAWSVLKASTGSTTNPYRYVGKLGYLREAALDGYVLRRRY